MISVGIIGCGRAGQLHFEAINHSDDAQVLAIADSDKKVLRQREKEWGVEMTLERYTELLHLPWLDAVIIALPNHLHKDVTIQAVREHLHVLCEKPIATTTREADAMIDAAEKHDVLLMVAESMRYEKETIEITKLLREGAIGRPVFAELNWLHKFERYHYADRNWLNDPARSGGGQWIINGTHLVSALRGWFHAGGAGDVEQIFAK
ncbi:MAG: Gfo/Idh/MocA family oxidoreductase, partial [Candidatus Korarchaeota archaeon]|nr:Gfo/Idh/MocA family oxidoreductase [Candidatus Korarchaeota archaeon]